MLPVAVSQLLSLQEEQLCRQGGSQGWGNWDAVSR